MASENMTWQDAIIAVLKHSAQPLHYQRITELIGERGLRALSGATPSANVRASLLSLIDAEGGSQDERIRRVARGVYEFVSTDEDIDTESSEEQDIEEVEKPGDPIGVPAFGLYWEKDKVKWGGKREILGRQTREADTVNFADQQGVYLLHKNRAVVYVGQTTKDRKGLFDRLRGHTKNSKALRWDRFSWFGFREVSNDGELKDPRSEFELKQVINVLESVLIEALEPPVNGQRGAHLGDLYVQVPDSKIAQQQSREFLQDLVG